MTVDPIPPSLRVYLNSPQIAQDYDSFFAANRLFPYDTAVLDEMLPQPCRLIDLGCGTGRHVVHFAARGFDVTGVDLSTHMLLLAAAKCNAAGVQARLLGLNVCDLSKIEPESFDAAICMFSTLGMIRGGANRLRMIREAARLLRPGGRFVVHVHNRWHNLFDPSGRAWLLKTYLYGWLKGDVGDKRMEQYRGIPDMFLHVFSLRELRRLAARSAMSIERVVYLNEPRDAELPPGRWRSVRANGFVVACRKSS